MKSDLEKRLEKHKDWFRRNRKEYSQKKIDEQAALSLRYVDRDPKVRRNNFGEFVEDK